MWGLILGSFQMSTHKLNYIIAEFSRYVFSAGLLLVTSISAGLMLDICPFISSWCWCSYSLTDMRHHRF